MNPAYLKKSSNARLLTRLTSSQTRRLASAEPTAIRATSAAKKVAAGRSVGTPQAVTTSAAASAQNAAQEIFSTRSDPCAVGRGAPSFAVAIEASSTPGRGQWSISVTSR